MATHPIAVAATEAAPWVERLARLGFAVKGVLYLTVGVLSARSAIGAGGHTVTDSHDAMGVLHGTFGRPLLGIIALGLAGYGLWLLISAATDAENKGRDAMGIAKRIGAAVRGVVHLALAWTATSLLLWRSGGDGDGEHTRHWTARALEAPGGTLLVWAVALSIGGYGLWQLYCAATAKLDKQLDLRRLRAGARHAVIAISRFGIAARAIVFVTIAVLFARAAMTRNPNEAGSTGDSMKELFAFGRWPFAAIAAGVAAYGLYQLIEARYRRIRAS